MNTRFRNLSVLILASVFAFGLTACNTIHGIGKDTEKAGEKIQQESNEHKSDEKDDGGKPSAMVPSARWQDESVKTH